MSFRITSLMLNGREYERRKGRTVNRWTYLPKNGHARTWVHRTSRLHFALERLAEVEEENYRLREGLSALLAHADATAQDEGLASIGAKNSALFDLSDTGEAS
jgi:hypothetical protein